MVKIVACLGESRLYSTKKLLSDQNLVVDRNLKGHNLGEDGSRVQEANLVVIPEYDRWGVQICQKLSNSDLTAAFPVQ